MSGGGVEMKVRNNITAKENHKMDLLALNHPLYIPIQWQANALPTVAV